MGDAGSIQLPRFGRGETVEPASRRLEESRFNPPPHFSPTGNFCFSNSVIWSVMFQSAPRLSAGGNDDIAAIAQAFPVSIRPPPFGGRKPTRLCGSYSVGEFQSAPRLSAGGNFLEPTRKGNMTMFQSAPRLSAGGNMCRTCRHCQRSLVSIRPPPFGGRKHRHEAKTAERAGFNPPPAFRREETPAGGDPAADCRLVSIRPPPFGGRKLDCVITSPPYNLVSIRPPPFGGRKPPLLKSIDGYSFRLMFRVPPLFISHSDFIRDGSILKGSVVRYLWRSRRVRILAGTRGSRNVR
jgi:hypothetical protein